MPKKMRRQFIGLLCLVFSMAGTVLFADGPPVDFNRDIRPLLSDKCFHCHGPDPTTREADLRLDELESFLEDRGGYAAVVPHKPDESELIERITTDDEFMRMPPEEMNKDLTPEEIDLLRRWIAEGAEWAPAWAYIPPTRHEVPEVEDADWPRNEIDHFVLARLEAEGVKPNPETDPVTLVRRLSFDLIGLPPDPKMVAEYLADPTDETYERLVDQLLASPHFGERLAIYWFDLVRFADTVGYHGDQEHHIWPYRDYVIHAFNENMPFDQFTREQLAGDLLPETSEDQLIATGYNRMLQTSHEGGVQPKEYRAIYLADRVRNISQVWMGATMGCAQCHDHKYDPITAHDFYAMGAFFADVDDEQHLTKGRDATPTIRYPEKEVLSTYQRKAIAELDEQIAALDDEADAEQITELKAKRDEIAEDKALTMVTESIEPREVRLLNRGDWQDDTGPVVEPAVPEFLGKLDTNGQRATRLDLANWLVDAENGAGGLTARVMINRFWYLMFGEGLSRVLDDFGGQGEVPTHPELLDNLSVEFVESGWDIKHVLKQIVTSSAYRQTSQTTDEMRERDPLNKLLARQNRFRLPAEFIRDTTLSISGLLDTTIGGRSVKPWQPPKYYEHLNFPKREYEPDTDNQQWRRGVYVHWQRQYLHPMLKALDAPSREECEARRPRSNTALAALVLLNDPNSMAAARGLASRLLEEVNGGDDANRLEFAYQQSVSRSPDETEQQLLLGLLAESRAYYQEHPEATTKLFESLLGSAPGDEERDNQADAELAAWTTVARAILNMSETTTRN